MLAGVRIDVLSRNHRGKGSDALLVESTTTSSKLAAVNIGAGAASIWKLGPSRPADRRRPTLGSCQRLLARAKSRADLLILECRYAGDSGRGRRFSINIYALIRSTHSGKTSGIHSMVPTLSRSTIASA
jgi:hypothetical protein